MDKVRLNNSYFNILHVCFCTWVSTVEKKIPLQICMTQLFVHYKTAVGACYM